MHFLQDKTVVLQVKLAAVKEEPEAYLQIQAILSELLKLPIKPNNQMWDKVAQADRNMHGNHHTIYS